MRGHRVTVSGSYAALDGATLLLVHADVQLAPLSLTPVGAPLYRTFASGAVGCALYQQAVVMFLAVGGRVNVNVLFRGEFDLSVLEAILRVRLGITNETITRDTAEL